MTPQHLLPPRGIPEFRPRTRSPKSNAERQREFRERNPGYYGRIKAKERAASKAYAKAYLEAERVKAFFKAYCTMPLMLPAPVEPIEIPGMTMLPLRDQSPIPAMSELRQRRAA
jgi:hypothetical protein